MKIHVIVNPGAGRRIIQRNLESIIGKMMLDGTASSVRVTRTKTRNDAMNAAFAATKEDTDLIIGCGGDGTINEIVNGLMRSGSGIPLAILAAGTSNDFATSLRLPDQPAPFCDMVQAGNYQAIDIGLVNDSVYFVNVAAFGIFTEISHKTAREAKNTFGLLAYYAQVITTMPEQFFKNALLDITADGESFSGDFSLCLVTNSMSVGSLRRLMHKADVSDGLFDMLLLERKSIFPNLSGNPRPANIFRSPSLQYLQAADITISSPHNESVEVDIDGEYYGSLPLHIQVCPRAISLLVPS
jgi:diacylglycerol kinase (ATP)